MLTRDEVRRSGKRWRLYAGRRPLDGRPRTVGIFRTRSAALRHERRFYKSDAAFYCSDAGRKVDPTGTTLLRRKYERDLVKRFRAVKAAIMTAVAKNDVLGLKGGDPQQQLNAQMFRRVYGGGRARQADEAPGIRAFAFTRSADKASAFLDWLNQEMAGGVLDVSVGQSLRNAAHQAWANVYIDSAYQKGIRDAASRLRKGGATVRPSYVHGAFLRPVHADRVGLIYTRNYRELRGITDATEQRVSRSLSRSMAEGRGAEDTARILAADVEDIGIARARVLARTETISAYAEAALNTYEEAQAEGVSLDAEWATAGDEQVCPQCDEMDGKVMSVDEARGLIPLHPNAVLQGTTVASYGAMHEMVRARFRGPAVHLRTRSQFFPVGPNHPMLTRRGWVKASCVREGDELLYDLRSEGAVARAGGADLQQMPLAEDAFEASRLLLRAEPSRAHHDFHGDRVFCEGEVDVVRPARGLLPIWDAGGIKHLGELGLARPDVQTSLVSGVRAGFALVRRAYAASTCLMCGRHLVGALAGVHTPPLEGLLFGSAPENDARPKQGGHHKAAAGAVLSGQRQDALALSVGGHDGPYRWDRVLSAHVAGFSGWAFDASTATGLYNNAGYVVKNCRCAWLPVVGDPDVVLE